MSKLLKLSQMAANKDKKPAKYWSKMGKGAARNYLFIVHGSKVLNIGWIKMWDGPHIYSCDHYCGSIKDIKKKGFSEMDPAEANKILVAYISQLQELQPAALQRA